MIWEDDVTIIAFNEKVKWISYFKANTTVQT